MGELFRFNTGRLYSKEGQRITAEVTYDREGKSRVIFNDHDRGIYGVLTEDIPAGWTFMSENARIIWIHNEYLHCRYEWDGEPGMWSKNYDFPRVQL